MFDPPVPADDLPEAPETSGALQLASFLETVTQFLEVAAGYRARAIAAGFDEQSANEMGVAIHEMMLHAFASV